MPRWLVARRRYLVRVMLPRYVLEQYNSRERAYSKVHLRDLSEGRV